MKWDPEQYLGFADYRLRPGLDLLAAIPRAAPARVVDLGCGTGALIEPIRGRWPAAQVAGIDRSAEMLAKARATLPGVDIQQADIADWSPEAPVDVLFSNAALHWLDDHQGLFRRLFATLAPGGVLAVQMPRNHGAPSHTAIAETVDAGPWKERLTPLLRPDPVSPPAFYHGLLAPLAARIRIWETEYLQILEGEDAVKEWTKGTALKPFLDALEDGPRREFEADYAARVRTRYERTEGGQTLFPFRRLFIIAEARA